MVSFTVTGTPVAQGSMVAFTSKWMKAPQMKATNERELRHWRRRVALVATQAAGGWFAPAGIPVQIRAVFRMPAPAKMPKGRIAPTVAPDVDKLLRACLDALTAEDVRGRRLGLYSDDKQVIDAHAVKVYATPERPPGVYLQVEALGLEDAS